MAFSPLPGYGDQNGHELVFNVVEAQCDQTHIRTIWDGLETKPLIPDPEHRQMIRDVLRFAIAQLIDEANPGVVTMTTHSPNLPTDALRKFHQIAAVFRQKGYQAGAADPYKGRHIWMMQKRNV